MSTADSTSPESASTSTQWQLTGSSAERYQRFIVPYITGPFAQALVDWAMPQAAELVVDVGCGTGAASRLAAQRVGPSGRVIGVDINAGMLEVARSLPLDHGAIIEWHEQSALELPIAREKVDTVLCAQALQFFPDRAGALAEMYRVLKPGGRVGIGVWGPLSSNPYFEAQVKCVSEHISPEVAAGLGAGFTLSDAGEILELLEEAGFIDIEILVRELKLPLPNLESFIPDHISATPLAAGFNAAPEAARQTVIRQMVERLAPYAAADGSVQVPFRSHLARARK
jgi:ubiquinone/menaquinone biosynthesis C-methylase UbiE